MYSFFAQDDFKVTPEAYVESRICATTFATPLLEGKNHIANFNYATGQLFSANAGSLQDRSTVKPNRLNFAPRLGVAYQLDAKTVLRAGYGIFYSQLDRNGSENQADAESAVPGEQYSGRSFDGHGPGAFPAAGFPGELPDPGALNLRPCTFARCPVNDPFAVRAAVELRIPTDAAVGSVRRSRLRGQQDDAHQCDLRRQRAPERRGAVPGVRISGVHESPGQRQLSGVDLTRRTALQSGSDLPAGVYLSKNIDNVSETLESLGSGGVQNIRDFKSWRGLSDFDVPNRVVMSYVYELPFGRGRQFATHGPLSWIIGGFRTSGSYTYASGKPFTVSSGGAIGNSIDPAGTDLAVPNVIGTPQILGNANCWFYASTNSACRALDPTGTNAFALQAPGQFGNAGRNIIRGPHTNVFDFAVHRDFPITERAGVEFRWEVFNLTNTVQFGKPSSDLSSGAIGSITTLAADPRIMQFALRFHF